MLENIFIDDSEQSEKFGDFAESAQRNHPTLFQTSRYVSTQVLNGLRSPCLEQVPPGAQYSDMWPQRHSWAYWKSLEELQRRLEAGRCLAFQESWFRKAKFLRRKLEWIIKQMVYDQLGENHGLWQLVWVHQEWALPK